VFSYVYVYLFIIIAIVLSGRYSTPYNHIAYVVIIEMLNRGDKAIYTIITIKYIDIHYRHTL